MNTYCIIVNTVVIIIAIIVINLTLLFSIFSLLSIMDILEGGREELVFDALCTDCSVSFLWEKRKSQ